MGDDEMKHKRRLIEMAEQNNGIITTAMVTSELLPRGSLKYLEDIGELIKVSRGVYALPEAWEDEYIILQSRYKRGIYCLDTALFLHDLTDRTPSKINMAFPYTYNLRNPKEEGILCKSFKEPAYSLGVTEVRTPGGNMVKAYNPEKTLCDILRPSAKSDIQVAAEAFKRYTRLKNKNIPLLSQYATELKVQDKVRSYLEVLL